MGVSTLHTSKEKHSNLQVCHILRPVWIGPYQCRDSAVLSYVRRKTGGSEGGVGISVGSSSVEFAKGMRSQVRSQNLEAHFLGVRKLCKAFWSCAIGE